MMGRFQRLAQATALAGVAAMLCLLVWKVAIADDGGAAADLASGKLVRAPAFTLSRLDREGELSVASLRGKAVVVNFWASWCVPCRDEAPKLEETYRQYKDKGLVVLGIDVKDLRQDARGFMRRYGISYPVVYDGKGRTIGKWGVTGYPETFFVDRTGKLVGTRIAGGVDLERNIDTYEQGIALALGTVP